MPVIGLSFKSINAHVSDKPVNVNINVNSTPRIDDIQKTEREFAGLKDVLSVTFTFTTKYEPDVGEIVIKGEVLYQDAESVSIANKWKKDKRLDDQLALEVMNTLFRRCLTKIIDLSEELRLPPPVQFPVVKPAEEMKK